MMGLSNFFSFVFYSVISAIIFLFLYSLFFSPEVLTDTFEVIREKISNSDGIKESVIIDSGKTNEDIKTNVRCSLIEASASKTQFTSKEAKRIECRYFCGNEDLEYKDYVCIKDKLICGCG